jgi:hypothetical protein
MVVRPHQHDVDHVIVSRSFEGFEIGVLYLFPTLIILLCPY